MTIHNHNDQYRYGYLYLLHYTINPKIQLEFLSPHLRFISFSTDRNPRSRYANKSRYINSNSTSEYQQKAEFRKGKTDLKLKE